MIAAASIIHSVVPSFILAESVGSEALFLSAFILMAPALVGSVTTTSSSSKEFKKESTAARLLGSGAHVQIFTQDMY